MPRSRLPLMFALSLLLGFLLGCGDAESTADALQHPAIDTLAGGVVNVVNSGPSQWVDGHGWRISLLRTIEPAEGSPGELSDIRGIAGDAAGNIYVLQQDPVTIKVFGPDGTWQRNIGREGDGPGEFRQGMLGLIGDTLLVQDPNNTRLVTFLTDGTFLASHQSQCCWFSSRALPSFTTGTVAIMGPPSQQDEMGTGAYYITRPDGTVLDTVAMPAREGGEDRAGAWTVRRTSGNSTMISVTDIPGQPQNITSWRPDGLVVRGNTADYTLIVGRNFSDTLRVIRASAPQLTLSEAQRDSLFEDAIATASAQWRDALREVAKRSDIPTRRPPWSALVVDDQNRIWVGLPDDSSDVGRFDVFSPDGVLLGRVSSPAPDLANGVWAHDRILVAAESDLGLPIIRIYQVNRTSEDAR